MIRLLIEETLHQLYEVAVESVPVILLSLTVITLITIVEFSFHLKMVLKQNSLVPSFSTLLMVRELGPVVTCLLMASRVGAGMGAEIATMKITEQLDALRLLRIDPRIYLLVPRTLACLLGAPMLVLVALAVAIFSGAWIASWQIDLQPGEFMNTMFTFTHMSDLVGCLIKSAVFGVILAVVSCVTGLRSSSGSAGVGESATQSVVRSSVLIILSDFLLTYLLYTV